MKYLVSLFLLALIGCSTTQTSYSVRQKALYHCTDVTEVDGQRNMCAYFYIKSACFVQNWDLRICGEMENK